MRAESAPASLPWRLFWVGLFLRVAYITLAHTYRFHNYLDHFQFGWEMGRIARALVLGRGYSDPFNGPSGPTAWCPPLYPLLVAAVFKLFGIYTNASAWVILTLNSVFSAATAPAVYEIARRIFSKSTGTRARATNIALWSAWLWALYPAAMQYAVKWVWDMALTTCLFTWLLVLTLRIRGIGDEAPDAPTHLTPRRFIAFGLLWGSIGLANSSLLTILPAWALWMIWPQLRSRTQWFRTLRLAAISALCCTLLILPWSIRTSLAFHAFVPIRSNFGAEFYESAQPSNEGFPWGGTISPAGGEDFDIYKQMGEYKFSQMQGERAKQLIHQNPQRYRDYCLKRLFFFWAGVPHAYETHRDGTPRASSLFLETIRQFDYEFLTIGAFFGLALAYRHRIPGRWLFLSALLFYPAVYYLVTVSPRFRAPLEPFMLLLTVYLFQSTQPRPKPVREPRQTPARP